MQAQTVQVSGAKPTFAKPASSDTVPRRTVLIVKNDSAASVDVTFLTEGQLPTGDDYPDKVYSVPASGEVWLPVLREYDRKDGTDPKVTFSATTSVTAAAVALR